MADQKITDLTELTSVAGGDVLAIVDDPAGSPVTKKITRTNLVSGLLANVVEDTTPQLGGDLDLNGNNIDFPTTANISDCLDEDNMASDSATALATQQSIKAYVDTSTPAASTTTAGVIEVATAAETTTGTDATRAVSPDGLAGSKYGERALQCVVQEFTTDLATGDGQFYMHIDSRIGGMDLVDVHAEVITAGTTGTTDIQIRNVTQAADMLSTKITIDSGETGSDTADTPPVIDTANDDVAENDVLRVDIDAVSTTAPKGLIVTLGFRLP